MVRFQQTTPGGGVRVGATTRLFSAVSAFLLILARELLARPARSRASFLVVAMFIVLLFRLRMMMPISNGNEVLGVSTDPLATATATATATAAAVAAAATTTTAKHPDKHLISKADDNTDKNNNSKPPTVLTSMISSTTESKTPNMDFYNNRITNTITHSNNNTIPRNIYMFWSSGCPASDRVEVQLVRKSWEYFNSPDNYTVHCLDFAQAEFLTDRRRYVPDSIFDHMKVQARSDVYRTLILYRHGGIWVDASLFCNMPLDHWLDLQQTDLISFFRTDKLNMQKQLDIQPWVTSWFLAAPKESYILSQVVNILSNATEQAMRIIDVNKNNNKMREYFWWHRIVSDLARRDAYIMNRIQTKFVSADPMHCRQEGYEQMAPVLKKCGSNKMYSTFATAHVCCTQTTTRAAGQNSNVTSAVVGKLFGKQQVSEMAQATANLTQKQPMTTAEWNVFCADWNCTMHSRNMHRIDDFKALYGNETFGKLPFILYSD
jgi:Capsular polysaccharide synthesis protein